MIHFFVNLLKYLLALLEPKDVKKEVSFKFEVGQRFLLPFSKDNGEAKILGRKTNRLGTNMYRILLSGGRITNLSEKTISASQERGAWVVV